jgi:hypothetical protein
LFATVVADRLRVRVTDSVGVPTVRLFMAHRVEDRLAQQHRAAISKGRPARASTVHSAPYGPERLVDGDTGTRWGASGGDPDPWVEVDLGRPRKLARARIMELADRVRDYAIEVRLDPEQPWRIVHRGGAIGPDRLVEFERVTARYVRLHVLKYDGPEPTLWEFQLDDRPEAWEDVGPWSGTAVELDLTPFVTEPGQYEVRLVGADGTPAAIAGSEALFEGVASPAAVTTASDREITVNRTQAVGPGASTVLRVRLTGPGARQGRAQVRLRG